MNTTKPLIAIAFAGALLGAAATSANAMPTSARLTCQSVAVRSTHGGPIAPMSHLSEIRQGRVLVLSPTTGATAKVPFGARSGRWLRSAGGARYALAGQPITRDGRPGGRYVIAARLQRSRRVLCAGSSGLRARAADTPSVSADGTLLGVGILETPASTRNMVELLKNVSTQKVCTNTRVHPDGARLVSHPTATVWCFSGAGAWLNHPDGVERNADGSPMTEYDWSYDYQRYSSTAYQYRHYVSYLGATVPAAKRPSAKGNGEALLGSAIAWRPYAPNFHNPAGV